MLINADTIYIYHDDGTFLDPRVVGYERLRYWICSVSGCKENPGISGFLPEALLCGAASL